MALTCLRDTSAWNRLDRAPALATEVTALLRHGEVGYSDIERLEVLRSHGTSTTTSASPPCSSPSRRSPSPKRPYLRAGQVQEQLIQKITTEA